MQTRSIPSVRNLGLLAGIASIAALSGCGGGGSSSASVAGQGGSTSSGTSAGGTYTNDFDAPVVQITKPARGQYFDAGTSVVTVEGSVTDPISGVQTLTLNGTVCNVDAQGNFTLPVALANGVNILSAHATDRAGNVGTSSVSVMYCPAYRLATDDVPGAAGTRLSEGALNTIAPVLVDQLLASNVIQTKLTASSLVHSAVRDPIFNACLASADVSVIGINFSRPVLTFDTVTGGVNAHCEIPNLRIDLRAQSFCGIGYSVTGNVTASNAVIDLGLDVALQNGQYMISARSSSVNLQNFRYAINGIPSIITNLVYTLVKSQAESRLADALKTQLPPALSSALQGLAQPITQSWNGRTVTFRAEPQTLAWDDAGFQVDFASNVTTARNPIVPMVPGSYFVAPPAGTVPQFGPTSGFYATVNENLLNRALFSSWQAGFWTIQIDTAFMQQFGVNLPFQLDAQLIALFFPAIRSMIAPGMQIPVAIKLEPQMQPVIEVTGVPDLVRVNLGELHMTLLLDFGAGYQPFFTTALHMRAGASASFANNAFSFTIGQNVDFEAELLSAAIPLNGIDMARFMSFIVPPAIQVATQTMKPIPLPTLQGLSLMNLQVYRDGYAGEFCTVSGDIR